MAPPRIVVVTTYYHPVVGGCETHARQVAHYLGGHGFEVQVLTRRTPPGAPVHDDDRGVPVRRLPPAGLRRGVGKWLLVVPMFLELWRRRRQYDLVYCVDLRGLALASWLAARLAGKPVVMQAETPGAIGLLNWDKVTDRQGLPGLTRLSRVLFWPFHRIYASADAYTCVSRQFVEEGVDVGVPRERLHYIPHAVDELRFHPPTQDEASRARRLLGLPGDRLVVMFLGRLGVEKGLLDLLDAWKRLAHPSAILAVVGPDMTGHDLDAGPAARQFVTEHGLEASVRFLGVTLDPAPVLHAADVFVQPSHYEAFGISLIEAMASGLPIVASGVGGMLDFLVDGENAVLTGAQQPARLSAALAQVLGDVALRARLGSAARATVVERFTVDAIGRATADLFETLVRR